jgi:class 3 adenylate cyclase
MTLGAEPGETRYVSVGGADVAYQVVGQGPFDVLYCYGLGSHVDFFWDMPWAVEAFRPLVAISRLMIFDRRGTGASGSIPPNAIPTWEELTEDMLAVLDAVGSASTAVMATLETGPIAILFAAMHPERVSHLVLLNTTARYQEADGYPIGFLPEAADAVVELLGKTWGTEELTRVANPSWEDDSEVHRLGARLTRASATPSEARSQYAYFARHVDVRNVLPLIRVPTLVIHVKESPFVPIAHGLFLAEHIENARFFAVPGGDVGAPSEEVMAITVEFLTGDRPSIDADRVLTTVLFTDIVGSTQQAASIGDRRWRHTLDAHNRAVREQLKRFRGREIKTTGDGFVACFDGPARAIHCACSIVEVVRTLGLEVRVGLHTGECEVRGNELGGLSVHIAARIGDRASSGEVLVSGTVKDLVIGSGIALEERGEHELKGVPGTWRLFAVRED